KSVHAVDFFSPPGTSVPPASRVASQRLLLYEFGPSGSRIATIIRSGLAHTIESIHSCFSGGIRTVLRPLATSINSRVEAISLGLKPPSRWLSGLHGNPGTRPFAAALHRSRVFPPLAS